MYQIAYIGRWETLPETAAAICDYDTSKLEALLFPPVTETRSLWSSAACFAAGCCSFDRPAFQDDIYQEGRMEDFDKAIEDTLIALNTGVLRTRDGSILKQADGKSSVQNSLWREKLYTITDMLTAIRRRLKIAKNWLLACKTRQAEISRLRMVATSFSRLGICPMLAHSSMRHRT